MGSGSEFHVSAKNSGAMSLPGFWLKMKARIKP